MEDIKIDRSLSRKLLRGRGLERALVRRARPIAARLQQRTPRDTGETVGTTVIETGHTNAKRDRVAVRIAQRGASVPLNTNVRYRRHRYMAGALRG